jgi:hypothetical protein
MATSTRVSRFSPAATQFFEDLWTRTAERVLAGPQGSVRREVREPMAALLDSPPEEYQPFKAFR